MLVCKAKRGVRGDHSCTFALLRFRNLWQHGMPKTLIHNHIHTLGAGGV